MSLAMKQGNRDEAQGGRTMRAITVKNTKGVNIDRIARSIERMARGK